MTEPGRGRLSGGDGGGDRYASPAATTLADFRAALDAVERVLAENGRRGNAWQRESVFSHVAHCRAHAETWTDGRQLEDVTHMAARALMALANALEAEAWQQQRAAALARQSPGRPKKNECNVALDSDVKKKPPSTKQVLAASAGVSPRTAQAALTRKAHKGESFTPEPKCNAALSLPSTKQVLAAAANVSPPCAGCLHKQVLTGEDAT